MHKPPPRTNTTQLTDDDLLLYDFLTLGCIPMSSFRRDDYPFHMNCGYTHSLSDRDLVVRLRQLSALGLMQLQPSTCPARPSSVSSGFTFPNETVAFNMAGGTLWERERAPDWNTKIWWLQGDSNRRTVAALELAILEDYLSVSESTGWFSLQSRPELQHHSDLPLSIYFTDRTFQDVVTASFECTFPDPGAYSTVWDTKTYEQARSWWTRINDPPKR